MAMRNVAFVFPGQGTQYVGMGMELADRYPEAAEVYDCAGEVMGMDIKKLCREGPSDELLKTENSQPTIHATTIAILKVVEKYGLGGSVTAGFSLGEYSALVYAGVFHFEDTVKLVKQRGIFMQNAVPLGLGKMCWITGLNRDDVAQIVEDSKEAGLIECSNFNCPGQIIVAGYAAAVEKAAKLAMERGAESAVFLKVSGPFHTSLLTDAGTKLHQLLLKIPLEKARIKVVSNVTAKYFQPKDDVRDLLRQHVFKAVMWEDSVNTLLDDGIDTFVEIGPKNLLTTFNQKTADFRGKQVKCLNVENVATLETLLREFDKKA
jgi:[acyl-carrier-protein] S-malonyltransferase